MIAGQMSCVMPTPSGYIKTNHEWPRMAQYPNKRFKAKVFAEKIMPLGSESFWEVTLTLTDTNIKDIKDVHAVDETFSITLTEANASTVVIWHVPNERWSDKTPFRISIATEPNAIKTLFIVTHSAKDQRLVWS